MRAHLAYLSYVLRHKWYVLLECAKLGILWRGGASGPPRRIFDFRTMP